jgi:hypothetical protein
MKTDDLARSYTSLARAIMRFPKAPWMDALSHGQLQSKAWAVDEMIKAKKNLGMVYVVGGWLGMLGPLMFSEPKLKLEKIRSFDIDPKCQPIADQINIEHVIFNWTYKAITKDMFQIDYEEHVYDIPLPGQKAAQMVERPDTIINTSCDHIADFEKWWEMIPKGKIVVIQNNDFKDGGEDHVNVVDSLEHMLSQAPVSRILFAGEREFAKYKRFMMIGIR